MHHVHLWKAKRGLTRREIGRLFASLLAPLLFLTHPLVVSLDDSIFLGRDAVYAEEAEVPRVQIDSRLQRGYHVEHLIDTLLEILRGVPLLRVGFQGLQGPREFDPVG